MSSSDEDEIDANEIADVGLGSQNVNAKPWWASESINVGLYSLLWYMIIFLWYMIIISISYIIVM